MKMKESFVSWAAATASETGCRNWLVVDGAWRNAEALLKMIDEVGNDCTTVLTARQIEES